MRTCLAVLVIAMFLCAGVSYADNFGGQDGGWKVSLDSLPMFGDQSEDESGSGRAQEYVEPTEYTYDATGRKVPVSTERSGTASPIH